jgi:hypothetical protein
VNTTIYKKLKVKDNKLMFNKLVIYEFQNNSILDEYTIKDTIFKMKKFLSYEKKYISQCIDAKIETNNNLVSLKLKCKDEDYIYNQKIDFISFLKNQIVIL